MRAIDILGEERGKRLFAELFEDAKHKLGASGFQSKATSTLAAMIAEVNLNVMVAHRLIAEQAVEIAKLKAQASERASITWKDCWREGASFEPGDVATHHGGLWLALTRSKGVRPNTSPLCWRLIVKRAAYDHRAAA